jgi:hypothetical protein
MGDTHDQNNQPAPVAEGDAGVSTEDANRLLNVGPDGQAGQGDDQSGTDEGEGQGSEGVDHQADAEKWKKLSRKNEAEKNRLAAELKKHEDAKLTEQQRLEKDRDTNKSRAEKAELELTRLRIARENAPDHATFAQLDKVVKRMSGDSEDDLAEDAKELWADFAPAPAKSPVPGKPKERLRGGGEPSDEDDETDPAKLAARIPRAR